jgi:hypothetical protein
MNAATQMALLANDIYEAVPARQQDGAVPVRPNKLSAL